MQCTVRLFSSPNPCGAGHPFTNICTRISAKIRVMTAFFLCFSQSSVHTHIIMNLNTIYHYLGGPDVNMNTESSISEKQSGRETASCTHSFAFYKSGIRIADASIPLHPNHIYEVTSTSGTRKTAKYKFVVKCTAPSTSSSSKNAESDNMIQYADSVAIVADTEDTMLRMDKLPTGSKWTIKVRGDGGYSKTKAWA